MTIVIVYIVSAGLIGTTWAENLIPADAASQPNIETNMAQANDQVSALSVPSSDTFTGCLSTTGRWGLPKGVLYYVQAGTAPGGTCQSGDKKVSFVNTSYINTLESRLARLETILTNVTRSGNNIYINRANVHIRSGSGRTNGTVNGLGNLIIGYNEPKVSGNYRTGSHNLVLGSQNNYRSYGGLVAGLFNEISGPYASVSGGYQNTASGLYSSVSGGDNNIARGPQSSISGGGSGIASGVASSISGGAYNNATATGSSVSGGGFNTAGGTDSSVLGGWSGRAIGGASTVYGGRCAVAHLDNSWEAYDGCIN